MARRVLIVTGGLISEKDRSLSAALRKQWLQWQHGRHAWLDLKIKLVAAEAIVQARRHRRHRGTAAPWRAAVDQLFAADDNLVTPELTEVVLATLLAKAGVDYELSTYIELFSSRRLRKQLLARCELVFASTTLLRDLSEVDTVVSMLKTNTNRIVLGGALASLLARNWQGHPHIDGLAVGYGEYLVPALAAYLRSGYQELQAPPRGRVERRERGWVMYAGVPESKDLDALPSPDWSRSTADRKQRYRMIYYESVRGCPYRCNFCNYPYLFDDTAFRYRSARKIADDWQGYREELGVEYITCLDSLFTMPHKRLVELCDELVRRRVGVKWICYARADDLANNETAAMMKEAGAHQVQIGIESGAQNLLDNMNKRCSVEANASALEQCRRAALTTAVSLIVGFPGETPETIAQTVRFLKTTPPDFFFLATFSTRVDSVPLLEPTHRARFALEVNGEARTTAPYWRHYSMSCADVGKHVRAMTRTLMRERVALNAALFYPGMLAYTPGQREALLDFQQEVANRGSLLGSVFDRANTWVDRRLAADVQRAFAADRFALSPSET